MPKSPFLVTGSIAYDLLLSFDGSFPDAFRQEHLTELSVSFFMPHMRKAYGGTAANVAWNLRLLRQDVALHAAVGEDGREYIERLRTAGVDTTPIEVRADGATAIAIVATDDAERQIAFFHPGASARRSTPRLVDPLSRASSVLITPEAPDVMVQLALACRELRLPYLFDPSQQVTTLSGDDLKRSIVGSQGVVGNDYEWAIVSEKTGWSAEALLEHTGFLVTTHGEHGATIQTKDDTTIIPACPPEHVVNPTGAGDAFRAGLLTGIASGLGMERAGRLGATLASFVVEVEQTQLEEFSLALLEDRYAQQYGEELPRLT